VTSSRSECWASPVPAADISGEVRLAVRAAAKDSLAFGYARLADLGWDELLDSEPELAVVTLFEEKGRLRLTGPALDAVVLQALQGPYPWAATRIGYPEPGRLTAAPAGPELSWVAFDGLDETTEQVLVPVPTEGGVELRVLPAGACRSAPVAGLDESAGLYRVRADLSASVPASAPEDWVTGLMAARRALAHELIGVASDLLRIAIEHVSVREQFGRPIGANQAVQHSLATARVELSAAEELTAEAWRTRTPLAAAAAKGTASRASNTVAATGQQVLGAIGYTWEHSWRYPLRRAMLLSVLLGSADECDAEVGTTLVRTGYVRIGSVAGDPA
jgi:Acyl-CoA dehydrogenase, C-terminal domain